MDITDFFSRTPGAPANGWEQDASRYAINGLGQIATASYDITDFLRRPQSEASLTTSTLMEVQYFSSGPYHIVGTRIRNNGGEGIVAVLGAGGLSLQLYNNGSAVSVANLASGLTPGNNIPLRLGISVSQTTPTQIAYTVTLTTTTGAAVGAGSWTGTIDQTTLPTSAFIQNVAGAPAGYQCYAPTSTSVLNWATWSTPTATASVAGDSSSLRAPTAAWLRTGGRSKTANPGNRITARVTLASAGRVNFVIDTTWFAAVGFASCPNVAIVVDGFRQFKAILPGGYPAFSVTTDELTAGQHDISLDFVTVDLSVNFIAGERWGQSATIQALLDVVSVVYPSTATLGTAPSFPVLIGFGDSNTEGAGALDGGLTNTGNDATESYVRKMAALAGMDFAVVGWASQAFESGGQGNVPSFINAFNYYYYNQPRDWSDVYMAICTHGLNGSPSQAQIQTAYSDLRVAMGATKYILAGVPWTGAERTDITAAVAALADAYTLLADNGIWSAATFIGNYNPHLSSANHTQYAGLLDHYVPSVYTGVSIDNGSAATVGAALTLQLEATTAPPGGNVTWSILTGQGTVGSDGLFTAPEVGQSDKVAVVKAQIEAATDSITITTPAAGSGGGGGGDISWGVL